MSRLVSLSFFLVVLMMAQYSYAVSWNVAGDWAWAPNCDFNGNDLAGVQTDGAGCGPRCQATGGCTHFAWTPPNNCWLKKNSVTRANAFDSGTSGIVCGLKLSGSPPPPPPPPPSNGGISWSFGGQWAWANGCDFPVNDIGGVPTDSPSCGPKCEATAGCTHFTWTPPNNCWLKKGGASANNAFKSNVGNIVCGYRTGGSPPNNPPPPPPSGNGGDYVLVQNYDPNSFVNGNDWDFFTAPDPTHGFVNYIDRQAAKNNNILRLGNSNGRQFAYLGSSATGNAPNSIRVTSKRSFTGGLLIFDAQHIPTGCGTWPAFWSFGPNWPHSGEIDVMEGVHGIGNNAMTLHTSPGCRMGNLDCNAGTAFIGCGIHDPNGGTFGPSFNNNPGRGGVYAMEWVTGNNGFIRLWTFPRNQIPGDIASGRPRPSSWPAARAHFPFGGDCNSNHFVNHNIIIDLTFCGDWAGATFGQQCAHIGKSCPDFLRANAGALSEAYFEIFGVQLYRLAGSQAVADEDQSFNSTIAVDQQIQQQQQQQDQQAVLQQSSQSTSPSGNTLAIVTLCLGVVTTLLVLVIVGLVIMLRRKVMIVEKP